MSGDEAETLRAQRPGWQEGQCHELWRLSTQEEESQILVGFSLQGAAFWRHSSESATPREPGFQDYRKGLTWGTHHTHRVPAWSNGLHPLSCYRSNKWFLESVENIDKQNTGNNCSWPTPLRKIQQYCQYFITSFFTLMLALNSLQLPFSCCLVFFAFYYSVKA